MQKHILIHFFLFRYLLPAMGGVGVCDNDSSAHTGIIDTSTGYIRGDEANAAANACQYSLNNYDYRFGFNGKEGDDNVKGDDNQQDYGFRIHDPRVGRFLSVDPLRGEYPWYSSYQFAGNMPIWAMDVDGLEPSKASTELGEREPAPYNGNKDDIRTFYGDGEGGWIGGSKEEATIVDSKVKTNLNWQRFISDVSEESFDVTT